MMTEKEASLLENPKAEGVGTTETTDSLQEVSLNDSLVGKIEHMTNDPKEQVDDDEEFDSEITEAEPDEPVGGLATEGQRVKKVPTTTDDPTSLKVGGLLGNKEIEEAAMLAATVTREAAAAAQEGLLKASNEAKSFFGALWSSFDGPADSRESEPPSTIDVKERFSIDDASEKILESFRCKLIQQYVSSNNSFTKPKSIGFSGMFHILDNYISFEFDNMSNGKPVVVPDKDIREFRRESDGVILIDLRGSRTFVVGHFTYGAMEVESAMNLLGRKKKKDPK